MTTENYLEIIIEALKDKKGEDIRVLNIKEVSSCADYFVIVAGNSKKQIQALADNVEEKLSKVEKKPIGIEGYNDGTWILQDYNDIVVHIFSTEHRIFYDLERIWKDGIEIKVD